MKELLLYLSGILLALYEIFVASPPSPALLGLAIFIMGFPMLVPPRKALESKDYLTPLDKAWLGYHHYISGPDA